MSEQKKAIAKLEFPKQGEVVALNKGESFSEISSVPPSVMLKRILKTNTDEILAEYDRHLLEDWDRRFHEANSINPLLEDLDKDSL